MADVFISHASSTTALVHRVADALRALGLSVWWDDELPVHRPFSRIIRDQLQAAKAVLVVWSADAVDADWVLGEAEVGRSARSLVQISADGTIPPLPFNQTQYADLTGWRGDLEAPAWRKVVASIATLASGVDPASSTAPTPTHASTPTPRHGAALAPQRRRWAIVTALGLLAVLAGVLVWYATRNAAPVKPAESAHATAPVATHDGADGASDTFAHPAIAVLPFENLSEDPKQALFADGLAEDLITRLSAWRTFPVIARASSFQYRGEVDIKRVAEALNVRYLVQGSVRRGADRIRVSAQLVDAHTGATLWSQTFDRPLADFFDLQDEISTSIAAPLVDDLTRAETNRAQQRGTRNLDAWSLYTLGMQQFLKSVVQLTPDEVLKVRPYFEQAIAIEPGFASAHAALGAAYAWEWQWQLAQGDDEHRLDKALESARRAVALDPLDPFAHEAMGEVLIRRKETVAALAAYERAIELNPSSSFAWAGLANAKGQSGDPQGSIIAAEHAIRLSPNDPRVPVIRSTLSEGYYELGQFDKGLEQARMVVSANPANHWGYIDSALNEVGLGQIDRARAAIAEARRVQPALSMAWLEEGPGGLSNPDMAARWAATLRTAGLE